MNDDLVANSLLRSQSSINHSLSKQMYSFGKAERFRDAKRKDNYYHFYSLPETKSGRGTTMGYGNKYDFTKESKAKCPNLYAFPNHFDPQYRNSPQYTFGVSRNVKKLRLSDMTPGPQYDTTTQFGDGSVGGTIPTASCDNIHNKNNNSPGPGQYKTIVDTANGRCFMSKFKNIANVTLDLKARRFDYYGDNKVPGPGQYKFPSLINKTGQIFQSKYHCIPPRSILERHYPRKKIDFSPGPGEYKCFSEFEGYDKNLHKKL